MKSRQKKSNSPFGPERNRAGAAVFSPRTQACSSRPWKLGVPQDPPKAHDLGSSSLHRTQTMAGWCVRRQP